MKIFTQTLHPPSSTLPQLYFQLIQLDATLLVWVSSANARENTHLADAWACAIPSPNPAIPTAATSLYRSSHSDAAPTLAARLARRFKCQTFVSLDLGSSMTAFINPNELSQHLEKSLIAWLKEVIVDSHTEDSIPSTNLTNLTADDLIRLTLDLSVPDRIQSAVA